MKNKERVEVLIKRLESGLDKLLESERYKQYLNTMSKFHKYSVNNIMLINLQMLNATLVASYKKWHDDFNRCVKPGEKALYILAPVHHKIKKAEVKKDSCGEIMLNEDDSQAKEYSEGVYTTFRAVPVFDVSQTDGEPLPSIGVEELNACVSDYNTLLQAFISAIEIPVIFEDLTDGVKGMYVPKDSCIVVQQGMSESQTLKTLVHEAAHSIMHGVACEKNRQTKEVEAESVAYVVCQHFGIDTSEYSFGYVAGWGKEKSRDELKNSLQCIQHAATQLIDSIEVALKEDSF